MTAARGKTSLFCYDVDATGTTGATIATSHGNLTRTISPPPATGQNPLVSLLAYDSKNNLTQTVSPKGVANGATVTCTTNLSTSINTLYATDLAYDASQTLLLSATRRWTHPDLGQLGNNSSTSITRPVRVSRPGGIGLLSGIVAISAGNDHSVALRNDGTVWTWGNNANGELGANSTAASSLTPVQVVRADGTALRGVTAIAAGGYHTLAVTSDGSVYAWGQNAWGQLGNNSTVTSGVAVQVLAPGGGSVLSGAAGVGAGLVQSLVLTRDGGVLAWGFGGNGQLGTGNQASPILPTTVVASPGVPLTGITSVIGGGMHSVSLGTDGGVRTWGRNGEGQLGNGTTTNSSLPVTPTGVSGMTSIGAGLYHTLSTVAIQRQQTTTYGYDRMSRLTTSTNPSGTTSYGYDPVGNRQSVTQGGGTTSSSYDRADRVSAVGSVAYTVNTTGNVTTRGSDTFTYDQANRLTSATVNGATTTFSYNGDGDRRSSSSGGVTTTYVSDVNGGLPALLTDGGRTYVYGLGLAYAVDSTNAVQVYPTDGLGSVRAVTNATGSVIQTYQTDAFGVSQAEAPWARPPSPSSSPVSSVTPPA